jgi:hypothetical protein
MNIQDEAYSEAMDEIADLKETLNLRDVEIGALRREIGRRNAEIDGLKTALQGIIDEEFKTAYERLALALERLYCQGLVKDEKYWEEDRALIWKYRQESIHPD